MPDAVGEARDSGVPSDANAALFDGYADRYADTVNQSIAASGEDVAYFGARKAQEIGRWLRATRTAAPARVLDFGCGTGLSSAALSDEFGPAAAVTGFDVSPASIETARARHDRPGLRFVSGAGQTLPFADATFDLAMAACVFHHIDRHAHAHRVRELARVLRPGGVLFMFEHNPMNPLTVRAVRACPFDEGVKLLRPWYAVRLLRTAGFAVHRPRFYFFFPSMLARLRPLEPVLDALPLGAQYFVAGRVRAAAHAR